MSQVSKRRPERKARTKATANELIAETTASKFTLSNDQVEQVKIILDHNDTCSSVKRRVSLFKAWDFLKQHYGLKMGASTLEKVLCEKLGRTSWGSK